MNTKVMFDFLKKIKKNNNKEWFHANQALYAAAKEETLALTAALIKGISAFDPRVALLEPKQCLFRVNKDIRFSKDKSPYKTNIGIAISPNGKQFDTPGYYLHVEPGASFLAGGIYMPPADKLAVLRQEIDYNGKELEAAMKKKEFKKYFTDFDQEAKLVRLPKGFEDAAFPEWIKLKSFTLSSHLDDETVLAPSFVKTLLKASAALYPVNMFLANAFDEVD